MVHVVPMNVTEQFSIIGYGFDFIDGFVSGGCYNFVRDLDSIWFQL